LPGLLDRLASTQRYDAYLSIVAHLRVLLNAKAGSAVTAPDYGVVDFTDVVHDIPRSIHRLQDSIRATILTYEPRLRQVTVRFMPGPDPLSLTFDVSARMTDDKRRPVQFSTRLDAGGRFDITD